MSLAVFCDLNTYDLSLNSFNEILYKIDKKVTYIKFYNYSSKRHGEYKKYIKECGAECALFLDKRKTNHMDIRECIDVIIYLYNHKEVDAVFLIVSSTNAIYLLRALREFNVKIILGVKEENILCEYCDEHIKIEEKKEHEFLPYSNIEINEDNLKEVKEKLNKILDQKIKEKNLNSSDNIEKLIKKFF